VCRDAQTLRYLGDGITAFRYLTDGFYLKFRCKSWCAHTLLLYSNYRAGSSTGAGSVQGAVNDLMAVVLESYLREEFPDTGKRNESQKRSIDDTISIVRSYLR